MPKGVLGFGPIWGREGGRKVLKRQARKGLKPGPNLAGRPSQAAQGGGESPE